MSNSRQPGDSFWGTGKAPLLVLAIVILLMICGGFGGCEAGLHS